tara:strand:- start:436 stop:633 length:198 start_codon:yes stop_codon:yes gene_type:complete
MKPEIDNLKEYCKKRDLLIRQYMELKDLAEEFEEKAHRVSLEVEAINLLIQQLEQVEPGHSPRSS